VSDAQRPDDERRPALRAVSGGEPEQRPARDRPVLPLWFEGLDLSSAFPLAFTRRVLRRGLRRTRPEGWETGGRVAILIGVAVASALLLGPRLVAADLPTDPVFVGTPARTRVVANRDYDIVDEAETRRRQEQAVRQSRSVWDLDQARRLNEVGLLRAQLARVRAQVSAARPDEEVPPALALDDDQQQALTALRASVAGELALGAVEAPDDGAWAALVLAMWREPAVDEALVSAVDAALSSEVVGERALLERDQDRGIVVREVGRAVENEREVDDLDTIPDLVSRRQALFDQLLARLTATRPGLTRPAAEPLAAWGAALCRPTLTYNAAESDVRRQRAQEDTPPAVIHVRRGMTVLAAGETMTPRHLLIITAMERLQGERMQTRAAVGTGAFVLLLCGVIYLFGVRGVFRRRISTTDLLFTSGVLLLFLLGLVAAEAGIVPLQEQLPEVPRSALFYAIPVAWAAMQVRFVLSAEIAFLLALVAALLGGVTTEPGMAWTVTALLSSFAGTAGVGRVRSRWQVLLAGGAAGVVGAGAAITLELFRGSGEGAHLWMLALASLASGLLSGVLVAALTPVLEWAFGYVTDLKLLSLADLNTPLLRELVLRAPGTWHHSMRVARLSEAAAEAVGANALLTRVMALYHDVGKLQEPQYFAENQTGDNPHDRLAPEESAKMLRGHVTHGRALAAQHRLPRAVACVIDEHHADNLMEDVFRKALGAVAEQEDGAEVDEATYRYGGRLPRTRESALVMLADQMEAASRDLTAPSRELLARVVDHFLNRAVIGGSLADCDLSMRELEACRDAFTDALADLLHAPGAEGGLAVGGQRA
jgi:putative nucleotidyltransferase with HDIG domain